MAAILEKRFPEKVMSNFDLSSVDKNNQYFNDKIMADCITVCIHIIKSNVFVDVDLPVKIQGVQIRIYNPPAQEPQFDQIPTEVFERIGEFDLKIDIDPGAYFGLWRWIVNSPICGIRTPFSLLRYCHRRCAIFVP